MSRRNPPPPSHSGLSDRPGELQEAINEIDALESDRPSVEVNITGPHHPVIPIPGLPNSLSPKRSLIPKQLDTPLKKLAALLATLIIAGVSAVVAEIIQRITSK